MTTLNHIDGVDLHISKMGDRIRHGRRPCAERRGDIKTLGGEPDAPGVALSEQDRFCAGHGVAV